MTILQRFALVYEIVNPKINETLDRLKSANYFDHLSEFPLFYNSNNLSLTKYEGKPCLAYIFSGSLKDIRRKKREIFEPNLATFIESELVGKNRKLDSKVFFTEDLHYLGLYVIGADGLSPIIPKNYSETFARIFDNWP